MKEDRRGQVVAPACGLGLEDVIAEKTIITAYIDT